MDRGLPADVSLVLHASSRLRHLWYYTSRKFIVSNEFQQETRRKTDHLVLGISFVH